MSVGSDGRVPCSYRLDTQAPADPAARPRRPLRRHLADQACCACSGWRSLLMGAFVTVYNLGFRLLSRPFGLSGRSSGLVFLTIWPAVGPRPGPDGWDRFGRRRPVLWVATLVALGGVWVTVPDVLRGVLAGLLLVTVGFFGAHSVASSWVGHAHRSALLPGARCRHAGVVAVPGRLLRRVERRERPGGIAYDHGGWPGVAGYVQRAARREPSRAGALVLQRVPAQHEAGVTVPRGRERAWQARSCTRWTRGGEVRRAGRWRGRARRPGSAWPGRWWHSGGIVRRPLDGGRTLPLAWVRTRAAGTGPRSSPIWRAGLASVLPYRGLRTAAARPAST
ncbi:MFS transporter [Pseudonocardia sp. MCCB 268]|nr:MFS transporter [Pseudonocardia cytotoxica]